MSKREYFYGGATPDTQSRLHAEARAYYALLDEASRLGIPTSLDDPRSPRTVAALRRAIDAARAAR